MAKKSQIPNKVRQVLFRSILDYKSAYSINPEIAQERIQFFEKILEEDTINLTLASSLFSHFGQLYELSTFQLQNDCLNPKAIKSLIKDCRVILDFLWVHFEIKGEPENHMIIERKVA